MKFQNKYQTNADYYRSYESLRQSPLVENVRQSGKGHISFKFVNCKGHAELSAYGKLLIYWHDKKEKETTYNLLTQVLSTIDGNPIIVKPLTSTVYNIPYKTKFFNISWCREVISYVTSNQLLKAFLFGILTMALLVFSEGNLLWFLSMWTSLFFIFVFIEAFLGHPFFKRKKRNLTLFL